MLVLNLLDNLDRPDHYRRTLRSYFLAKIYIIRPGGRALLGEPAVVALNNIYHWFNLEVNCKVP